jgi:hypothetical protein
MVLRSVALAFHVCAQPWPCQASHARKPAGAHAGPCDETVQRECLALRHNVCIAHDWVRCNDRRPTPAVPCAAGYAWGENGSNQCPTSYYAIVNAVACDTAATAAGKAYLGSETDRFSPSGCYFHQFGNGCFFNDAAVGAGVPRKLLLCSGAAPPRMAG